MPRRSWQSLSTDAEIFVGDVDGRLDPRLLDHLDAVGVGHVGRVVQLDHLRRLGPSMAQVDAVDHRRRGRDQVEVIFAGQPLLDDLEVEQAEEAAAEAEAQRGAGLHLEAERGVVEAELVEAVAELLEVGGVDREQAAEHHRLDQLEAGERLRRGALGIGDRVADAGLGDFLDLRGDEADLAGAELVSCSILGRKQPTRSTRCVVPACMNLTCWPFLITPSITRTRMTTPR